MGFFSSGFTGGINEGDLIAQPKRESKAPASEPGAPATPQSPAPEQAPVDPEHEGGAADGIILKKESTNTLEARAQREDTARAVENLADRLEMLIKVTYESHLNQYKACIVRGTSRGQDMQVRRDSCRKLLTVPKIVLQLHGQHVHNHIMIAPAYKRVMAILNPTNEYKLSYLVVDQFAQGTKSPETVFAVQMVILGENAYPDPEANKDIDEAEKAKR